MELVLRAIVIYLVLFVILRASGNRQFSQLTPFDLVLLLVIAEVTQNALVGQDFSLTAAIILIATLVGFDIVISFVKRKWERLDRFMEGVPILLARDGEFIKENLRKARVEPDDVMQSARETRGIERSDQIKFAILEKDGRISIIKSDGGGDGGSHPAT